MLTTQGPVNVELLISKLEAYFGGISAHQLYLLSDPNYRSKLDLFDIALEIEYYQFDEILQTIKNLESGCRKFAYFRKPDL